MRHSGRLTVSQAQYRLVAPGGGEIEAGSAEVTVAGGVLELTPAAGPALRVPPGRVAAVTEPRPYTIGVALADGTVIELSRLGAMRTRLLAELADARAEVAATASGAVGDAARFSGTVSGDSADLHVFDDALLVMSAAHAERISFAFIEGVAVRDYAVTVTVTGRPPLVVTRLGRRTDEFATLAGERLRAARSRTAAFLGSLLPGLDPLAQRAAAGLLRDGLATPATALDAIHPELSATLLRVAALPDRAEAVAALAREADLASGFKQLASVRQAAAGGTPWHDPAVTPQAGQHDSPGGLFRPGLAGAMAAGVMSGTGPGGFGGFGAGQQGPPGGGYGYNGPFGRYGDDAGYGGYWAYRALGAGMNRDNGARRQMTARADVRHGKLTPATEDLARLTATGDSPTVLAFALLGSPRTGRVAFEVLNLPEPVTFVYQADPGADGRAALNRALDDAGFAAAAVHAAGSGDLAAAYRAGARDSPLSRSLAGQVAHDAGWLPRVAALLAG